MRKVTRKTTAKVTKRPKKMQGAPQQHEAHAPRQLERSKRRREAARREPDEAVDDGSMDMYFIF
jgi:hypothetical protein